MAASFLRSLVRRLAWLGLTSVAGCAGWTQVADGPAMRGHAMAYDAARGQIVLFGGGTVGPANASGETWIWNGTAWSMRTPAHSPTIRFKAALAYDSDRQRVVLFGGVAGNTQLDDTWEWDGTDWHPMTSTTPPPPARQHHAMAFDAARHVVVLFGGTTHPTPNTNADLADTWTWDGTKWTNVTPTSATNSPPRRDGVALAFDPVAGNVVLFGGARDDASLLYYGDTWVWNGTKWTQQAPATSPPARGNMTMAYDASMLTAATGVPLITTQVNGGVVMFGGLTTSPPDAAHPQGTVVYPTDSYVWNGSTWLTLAGANPPPRNDHAIAYDAAHGQVIVQGGYTGLPATILRDTWKR